MLKTPEAVTRARLRFIGFSLILVALGALIDLLPRIATGAAWNRWTIIVSWISAAAIVGGAFLVAVGGISRHGGSQGDP